ncbi:MAG: glyoxalase [Solirubrobacteraceae bacterium]
MTTTPREPELAELAIADPPARWRALGFDVDERGNLDIGMVRVRLGAPGHGIVSWSLRRVNAIGTIDGLPSPAPRTVIPPPFHTHPNGATGIDHVVIATPDFDRTAGALARAGVALRRDQFSAGHGRLGFRRIGPALLELAHRPELPGEDSRFWGLALVVISLEALAERLGPLLGPAAGAVAPGRRTATLNPEAGLTTQVAFMSPEPP